MQCCFWEAKRDLVVKLGHTRLGCEIKPDGIQLKQNLFGNKWHCLLFGSDRFHELTPFQSEVIVRSARYYWQFA